MANSTLKAGLLIVVLTIFLSVIFYLKNKEPENNSALVFRACIFRITKFQKGRYDLELESPAYKKIIISDYNFRFYKEKIKIGDSLIKQAGSNCFFYRRGSFTLAENCENIREIELCSR